MKITYMSIKIFSLRQRFLSRDKLPIYDKKINTTSKIIRSSTHFWIKANKVIKNLKTVANAKCIHPISLSCGGKRNKTWCTHIKELQTVWTLSKFEIIAEESKNEQTKGIKERCTSNTISLTKSKPKQHTRQSQQRVPTSPSITI